MRRLLRNVFQSSGYAVTEARNESELMDALKGQRISLITLDLSLRHEDGLSIARSVRTFSNVPIVMVTARGDDVDRIVGLELGADDYIVKPFNVREVLARVLAVLRRTHHAPDVDTAGEREIIHFGPWMLDLAAHALRATDGREVALTGLEYKLLEAFVRHPGRVMSRDFLIDFVGGIDSTPLERSIDTVVSRLRKKIEPVSSSSPQMIKTVRGSGYIFAAKVRD